MSAQRSLWPRSDITAFAQHLFALLPRTDQRQWAEAYLRGLLTVSGRKSLQRLASAVPDSPTASQCLQQFINASPWDWVPVRRELARTVAAAGPVTALTLGMAVIPKRGEHSVGVHRRFVTSAGRTLSCQVGLGLFLSDEECSVPVDWELVLDQGWRDDADRLRRARVPDDAARRPEWAQVLDLVDRRVAGPLPSRTPIVADLHDLHGMDRLPAALTERGLDYLLRLPPGRLLVPAAGTPVRPVPARGTEALFPSGPARHRPLSLASVPVRVAGTDVAHRLWFHRPTADRRAVHHYLTSMADAGADRIASLLRHAERTRAAVTALGDSFGMLQFAGRSFPGWHHHMTMTSAAYAYSRLTGGSGPVTAHTTTPASPWHRPYDGPASQGPVDPGLADGSTTGCRVGSRAG
ncbi:IS701 family transposase [Streptomyces sp. NPDC001388]|uniref:IS701 family transposase n=1 Tax=unclassified Streptomyces TaxID=2593676 RepID=UPI00369C8C47